MKFTTISRAYFILLSTIVLLAIALGSVYLLQNKVIFQRTLLAPSHTFHFDSEFTEYFIDTPDGETINALLFTAPDSAKGLILYFHGNAGNLQRWGNYADDFTKLGWDILMVDYRGYGKSSGQPDEQAYYRDANTIWMWVQKNLPHRRLIIYGRSLGSAVASHLAGHVPAERLLLETPFDQLRGATWPILQPVYNTLPLKYTFPTYQHLQKVKCPISIVHGTNDWVVPLPSAKRLKPFLKPTDQFIIIEKGSHNNLNEFKEYHKMLSGVLQ